MTSTQISISWNEPSDNGGCSIIGYKIYIDYNLDGSFNEYDASNVNNKPFLADYDIDMSSQTSGNRYTIKVASVNDVGEIESDTISVILASVPGTPSAPTSDSDGTYLDIIMTAPGSDGGSTIFSYQLEIFESSATGWEIVAGEEGSNNLDLTHHLERELEKGQQIQARYRCKNIIGWSDYSSSGYLTNAGVPSQPPKPTYVTSDSTSITVEILPVESNNGATVTAYELWRDDGDYSSAVATQITGYDQSAQFKVTSLTTGVVYRFGVIAVNSVGDSSMSYYGTFAAAGLPSAPTAIHKDSSASDKTSISLYWDSVTGSDISTTGYNLYMTEYGSTDFTLIYDGSNKPQTLSYLVEDLNTSSQYTFKLTALNFNGEGAYSNEFTFNACTTPSGFSAPWKQASTSTSITINWNEPEDDGGCPISGYAVFRDDGAGGSIDNEVNSANDAAVRDIPTLRELTITDFESSTEGFVYRIKVTAFNDEGSSDSYQTSILYAGAPDAPTSTPTKDADYTDDTQITVTMALIADSDNGNSPIVTYHLVMDDGEGGEFTTVGGYEPYSLTTTYTITEGITRGYTYQFKYRTRNSAGWSDYSNVSYITAARVPLAPATPTLSSAAANTITLAFTESQDNGGSTITAYELYMDTGVVGSAFTKVTSYTDNSMSHTLSSLTSGTSYGFKILAVNAIGSSSYSNEVRFSTAAAPS